MFSLFIAKPKNEPLSSPYGRFIPRSSQIFFTRFSLTSRCLGTVVILPFRMFFIDRMTAALPQKKTIVAFEKS